MKLELPVHPIPAFDRTIKEYRRAHGNLPKVLDKVQHDYGTNPEVRLPHREQTLAAVRKGGAILVFEHTGVYTDPLDSVSAIGVLGDLAGRDDGKDKVLLDARAINILDLKRKFMGYTIEVAGVDKNKIAEPAENISVLKQAAMAIKHGENIVIAPDGAKEHWDIGLWAIMSLVKEAVLIFAHTKRTTNLNVLSYVPLFGKFIYTPHFARKGQITFSEPVPSQEIMHKGDRMEITKKMETAMSDWGKELENNPEALFKDSFGNGA